MESYADCAVSALVGAQDGKSAADERSRKHEKALVSPEVKVVRMHTKSGEKLMKKMNRAVSFVLIVLAVIAGFTCKPYVGLGAQIDINPPSGEITYPDAGETPVRGSFVLKGTAKDDNGVKAVSIVFENIDTKERKGPFNASVSNPGSYNVSWTAEIDNESTGTVPGHELVKEYPIPDGEYTAIVTVTDMGDKTSKFTKNYKIDNTPPVFIVSRPSTIAAGNDNSASADPYGSIFTVAGEAEDKNKIEDLTLKVPGTDISVSKKFVGKTINEEMATATKDSSGFTDPLYKYNDENGSPKIKAHIFLTDNARFFNGNGLQGEGNTSDWYYLKKDIKSIMEKGYTADVINDYFAGKKGSAASLDKTKRLLAKLYSDSDPEGQSVKQILKNARIMTDDNTSGTEKFSVFTLDPNKSPGYIVTNGTNMPSSFSADTPDSLLPVPAKAFFSANITPIVIVELKQNKNHTPLVQANTYDEYRASGIVINMYKCSAVSYSVSGNKKILNLTQSATPAYSLKFADLSAQDETDQVVTHSTNQLTVRWPLPNSASLAEGYYVIQVEGKDIDGNEFVAYDGHDSPGGIFTVKYEPAGNNIMISPSAPSGIVKEDFNVIASISSAQPVTDVRYKFDGEAGPSDISLPLSGGRYETSASVPIGTLTEGQHTVHFWAKNASNQVAKASISFIKDTKAPVPAITYPERGEEVAGTVRIMGSVSDEQGGVSEYAGVKKEGTKYIIGKQTSAPTKDTTAGWHDMDRTSSTSWEFSYNLDTFATAPANPADHGNPVSGKPGIYDIPVYVLTEDKVGNKAVTTLSVRYDSDGDKPIITVLGPVQNQTLGGTIQIFGTAVTRLNGPADVGEVYIQFSKDGNFNSTADGTFGTTGGGYNADWYNNDNGQPVPGTTSGGANWLMSINGNGEFNNPDGDSWEVYFRLRAKHKTATPVKYGSWSTPVKITIDKAYPTIGSPDPLKVGNDHYSAGMWIEDGKTLTGSLYDGSGIKDITISSTALLGSQTYTLQQALTEGWIAEDAARPSSSEAKNYKLQIPLTLQGPTSKLSEAARRKGEISIKIKIVENTSKELSREETLLFYFDVTKPAGDAGEYLGRYNGNVGVSFFSDTAFAKRVKDAAGSPADYSKLRLLINDTVRNVTSAGTSSVQFNPSLSKSGNYNVMLYKVPYIIKNDSGKWIVRGVAFDEGSGIQKIEAGVTVGGTSVNTDNMTITKHLGGQVSWEGEIDLSTLNDGKGKLSCKIYDERGNVYTVPDVDVVVKNNPIVVSDVTLKTTIGDKAFATSTAEDVADDEPKAKLTKTTIKATSDQTVTVVSSNFAFKSKTDSKIKVSFTGGEGTVKYRLKKSDGHELEGLTDITSGTEIDLKNYLASIGNSALDPVTGTLTPTTIVLELWDEAKGFTQGIDSAFAKINITTLFETIDHTAPTVVMLPFHWNGETDNSLYGNSRANGHVEIKNSGNSQVSGKVTLRGFAYDNIKIDSITATLPFSTPVTVTASAAADTGTSIATMDADGAELKVTRSDVNYSGYYVKWELSFDSSKITMEAAKDITVVANDGTNTSVGNSTAVSSDSLISGAVSRSGKKSATITGNGLDLAKIGQFVVFQTGDKQYLTRIAKKNKNTAEGKTTITLEDEVPTDMTDVVVYKAAANKTKVAVNSVPYITKIETKKRTASGLSASTIRASNGKYSIIKGDTAGFIEVEGFNLSTPLVVRLVKKDDMLNATETSGEGLAATASASGFTLKNDLSKSGYLEVFAGSSKVRAINNINAADKPYNMEADTLLLKNKTLTDDRYLRVFDMKKTQISNGSYPEMIMDGDDPVFGLINPAGYQAGYGKLLSFSRQPPLYQAQRIKFVSDSGDIAKVGTAAQIEYIAGAISWDQFAMAKDASGKYHYISVYNYNNAGMMYAYHSYAETETSAGVVGGWGSGGGYTGYKGKFAGEVGVNALALDSLGYHTDSSILKRYQYPKIVAKGRSDTAAGASIYIAYYDGVDNTNTKRGIKFRSFKVGDNLTGGSRNMAGTMKSNFAGCNVSVADNGSQRTWSGYSSKDSPNGRQDAVIGASRFFDMGVTSDNRVVLVYFDDEAGVLKLKYSNAAVDGSSPTGSITWVDSSVTFPDYTGTYVSMDIDSRDGIHIAAFDSSDGDLKYFYLPSYSSADLKAMTVDAAFSIGQWTQIKVKDGKPYIAYYSNTEAGQRSAIKLAVADGSVVTSGAGGIGTVESGVDAQGFVTGKWDCMTVPTLTPAQGGTPEFKKVNIGFDTSGRPVLGYLGNTIEFGKWLDE